MTNIKTLTEALRWNLLAGSHTFPGPDGGTCINEAAIVVAGFDYRKIESAHDCPPCFSRPIAAYAIRINDRMPDDLRQELLLPFVVRLAGAADAPEVERARADLIVIHTVRDMLPDMLRRYRLHDCAALCERAQLRAEACAAANKARDVLNAAAYAALNAAHAASAAAYAAYAADAAASAAAYAAYAADAADAAADAADAAANAAAYAADAANAAAYAANAAAYAANAAAYAANARRVIWAKAAAILDAALAIGRQAEPIELAVIMARARAAKRREAANSTMPV